MGISIDPLKQENPCAVGQRIRRYPGKTQVNWQTCNVGLDGIEVAVKNENYDYEILSGK